MIILEESNSSQTIKFIPREYTSGTTYTIIIKDELKNTEAFNDTTTSFTLVDYYYSYSNTFSLKEDSTYTLEIKDGSNVVYRDKIYCTNQTVSTYSINNNVYTERSSDNEFIVL